jgi:hypothetical protein
VVKRGFAVVVDDGEDEDENEDEGRREERIDEGAGE